jgi:hypothetical protein
MVSSINNIGQSSFQPQISQPQFSSTDTQESPTSFDDEDKAIISSQAKLLNELDKFNAGGDNVVDLAAACVMAKTTVSAEVDVINTKKHMIDDILDMGK